MTKLKSLALTHQGHFKKYLVEINCDRLLTYVVLVGEVTKARLSLYNSVVNGEAKLERMATTARFDHLVGL